KQANYENYQASFNVRKIMSSFFPFITFISVAITASILLMGGLSIINNFTFLGVSVTVGVLTAFISYLSQFFRPFMTLMQFQQVIESAMAASDRIYGLLEEVVELPDPEDPVPITGIKNGEIAFENVYFAYKLQEQSNDNPNSNSVEFKTPERKKMMQKMPSMKEPGMMMKAMKEPGMMMMKAMKVINRLPDPYQGFVRENLMQFPFEMKMTLFNKLEGAKDDELIEVLKDTIKRFGQEIPKEIELEKEQGQVKNEIPKNKNEMKGKHMMPMVPRIKGASQMNGPLMDKKSMKRIISQLDKMLNVKAGLGAASNISGGNSETMMGSGSQGGSFPKSANMKMMLRMLASIDIPEDVEDEMSENVKRAIHEERELIKHERSVGYVLENLNIKIPAGKTVAIVGETGAGKSTLVKLIPRFYDVNDGKILIDNINIKSLKKSDLRKIISMVPQDSFLFVGTIRENILYGIENPDDKTEAKMLEVSKMLGLHNFIEALPDGYNTVLKENASNISIGQRQLIAFARALMTNPIILILDEATSSVDPYTEILIQDALDQARQGRTTIIIAHRLSTIKNADWIFVIGKEKRGVLEQGTHEELIEKNGKYRKLLEMQKTDLPS
ncbi:MAG: ATP-binding cassette domain-containing protein, partial [Promethearchaeota archaeon]